MKKLEQEGEPKENRKGRQKQKTTSNSAWPQKAIKFIIMIHNICMYVCVSESAVALPM